MKLRVDEFQIADNPMRKNPQTSIIHLIDPKAIILVLEGHVSPDHPHEHYTYTSEGVTELYTFALWHCMVTDFDGEKHPIIIANLFKDAWHWYMAYMAWQDKQMHDEG